jgi:ABC-type lipoprotein export system ATPase subunit
MLETRELYKVYHTDGKPLEVLKGINLKIETGEFVSITGPSGAGKSTLLHLLGGLDIPTKGEVYFEGKNLYNLNESLRAKIRNRGIGFVFQFYHLLAEFSALENVYLPGLITGFDKTDQLKDRALRLLTTMGLEERIRHKPAELSGGEQQRVAIARALMNEPRVLLCDEPTGNLDSHRGNEIIDLLVRLNKENRQTIVVVTHEEEIAAKADRLIHLRDGKIVGEKLIPH